MKQIWKFELGPDAKIEMPLGANILCVQTQYDKPQIWALVDPTARTIRRRFRTYGTGHIMPVNPGEYIGTFQLHNGSLVFHVFEEK